MEKLCKALLRLELWLERNQDDIVACIWAVIAVLVLFLYSMGSPFELGAQVTP